MVENICKVYWFPHMCKKIKAYIENCLKCIEFSPFSGKSEGYLHSIKKDNISFQTLYVNYFGPLEKSNGAELIFPVIDSFTKFIKLYPCKSTTSNEAIKHMKDHFRNYSIPRRIISKRRTCFTSGAFKYFLQEQSIEHALITTATPRANGQVGRFNSVVVPTLVKIAKHSDKWYNVLDRVEYALNNSIWNQPTGRYKRLSSISIRDKLKC
ncbi:Pro-Pol polyprotein [Habropoda laboriosa]|uniref:RNA-directed DNA polymerase n=1 Tax=Habropoda laboriosa TaxID=597456 RepID=A0A0L7QKM0_9HYME|nr:Pro-Pol polyprotein [Habropoda laboriosa]